MARQFTGAGTIGVGWYLPWMSNGKKFARVNYLYMPSTNFAAAFVLTECFRSMYGLSAFSYLILVGGIIWGYDSPHFVKLGG